ncbi:hypothetical protein ARMGADRAFT_26149 [Armillaria gallica]|uniref:Uncharacterized protein n=1 Tax=Armillaria gallica TaxID=47427 RepID=A0A2H3ET96_ARMGA|nr:hypothetical protein ARMGADRAFT_26149 [Armillaria gallica]
MFGCLVDFYKWLTVGGELVNGLGKTPTFQRNSFSTATTPPPSLIWLHSLSSNPLFCFPMSDNDSVPCMTEQ